MRLGGLTIALCLAGSTATGAADDASQIRLACGGALTATDSDSSTRFSITKTYIVSKDREVWRMLVINANTRNVISPELNFGLPYQRGHPYRFDAVTVASDSIQADSEYWNYDKPSTGEATAWTIKIDRQTGSIDDKYSRVSGSHAQGAEFKGVCRSTTEG